MRFPSCHDFGGALAIARRALIYEMFIMFYVCALCACLRISCVIVATRIIHVISCLTELDSLRMLGVPTRSLRLLLRPDLPMDPFYPPLCVSDAS